LSDVQTSGEWREERLYVLKTIEDLQTEQRRQSEQAAVTRASLAEKAQRDIKAAHDKIRALESSGGALRMKNWIMTALLSGGAAVLFEVVKAWLPYLLHNK
jgi:hypothetical protein